MEFNAPVLPRDFLQSRSYHGGVRDITPGAAGKGNAGGAEFACLLHDAFPDAAGAAKDHHNLCAQTTEGSGIFWQFIHTANLEELVCQV